MHDNESAHSMVAGDTQQKIFDTYASVLKNAAHEAIHKYGISIPELVIFCVDEESSWFDLFSPGMKDSKPQTRLGSDEVFVFHGAVYISQFAKMLNSVRSGLGETLKISHPDQGLVKCVVLDEGGVSLFHIQPIPRLLN